MAIRTHTIESSARRATRARAAESLAALPAGTVAAIFDNRVDAIGAAVQLSVDEPEANVWIASGDEAAARIQAARSARSLIGRLAGALSDDDGFVDRILVQAIAGRAVLVTSASREHLAPLAGASHMIEFGRWTTREVRR